MCGVLRLRAVAEGFNFYYEGSMSELEVLGAGVEKISVLEEECLPTAIEGLIIGGGFPEMFVFLIKKKRRNGMYHLNSLLNVNVCASGFTNLAS